uniref:GH18 domain-containing protein n=1 Tax=Haptolina brevifila TaxID=156173 RepID=A0A7S2H6Z9_9EUKA
MVYSGTGAEEWVKYYTEGCSAYCSQFQCSLPACVPPKDMVLGIDGSATSGEILTVSKDVKAKGYGGVMVWYASVLDSATGKSGLQYGNMDASLSKLPAWSAGLQAMQ